MATLQFSFFRTEFENTKDSRVNAYSISNAFKIPTGAPAELIVVNGWVKSEDEVVHPRVQIVDAEEIVVFDDTQELGRRERFAITVLHFDFVLLHECGEYQVRIADGDLASLSDYDPKTQTSLGHLFKEGLEGKQPIYSPAH